MLIRELLAQKGSTEIRHVRPHETLLDAARKLREHNIGALLVIDEQEKLVGLISERDIVRSVIRFENSLVERPVSDVMTRSLITCAPGDDIVETLAVMNGKNIRHIPVLEGDRIRAMVSIREFDHACKYLLAQARTDELTGLANRRYFLESLEKELSRFQRFRTPFSVAMLDIDHFKHVNDTFGHDAGDEVLNALSKLLVRELRTFDGIGRLGGEEFAILFVNADIQKARIACDRLLTAIRAEEVVTSEGTIRYTASFGLMEINSDSVDCKSILRRVDKLLYDAKRAGRNRIGMDTLPKQNRAEMNSPAMVHGPGLASMLLASTK